MFESMDINKPLLSLKPAPVLWYILFEIRHDHSKETVQFEDMFLFTSCGGEDTQLVNNGLS